MTLPRSGTSIEEVTTSQHVRNVEARAAWYIRYHSGASAPDLRDRRGLSAARYIERGLIVVRVKLAVRLAQRSAARGLPANVVALRSALRRVK